MNRYFSLLGLREDAGKDDVKAAYERRVQKYKASDYADDPEYVRKKLAELKTAYEQAYRMAASGSTDPYRREDFDLPPSHSKQTKTPAADLQQAHRRLHDQEDNETRKKRAKRIRENEARKDRIEAEEAGSLLRRPDLSSLRHKAESLRDEIKAQAGELKDTVAENLRENSQDEDFSRPSGNHTAKDSGGTIIKTPSGASARSSSNKTDLARHGKLLIVIIVLIITIVGSIRQCSFDYDDYDDFSDDDYTYDDYEDTSYSFAFNDLNDNRDQAIFDTAMDSSDLLFDTGYTSSWNDNGYENDELQKQADRFAERYLEMEEFSDVITYLGDYYDEFYITTNDSLYDQVTEALKFYGFMEPDSAEGYINPYNDETIANLYDYLAYLNKYFDENGLSRD